MTGGALLLGHAAALATLAQAPGIGACMAAGLGSMWFGAAAGRAIATVVERRRNLSMLARIAAEAAFLVRRGPGAVAARRVPDERVSGAAGLRR